jgi:hypothetical protein
MRGFTLILLAFATTACFSAPVRKAKTSSSGSAKIAHKRTGTSATRNATGKTRSASAVSVRYVRNRRGKLVRVSNRKGPPVLAYQSHPDPDRYQQIQQALADRGYFKGEVNGQWGDDSIDALKRFQVDQKLDDDGHLTALTLTGLGLGPRHDSYVGAPPSRSPSITAPGNSAPTGSNTSFTPVSNSTGTVGPPAG